MVSEKAKGKKEARDRPQSNRIYKEDKEGETVFGEREDKDATG